MRRQMGSDHPSYYWPWPYRPEDIALILITIDELESEADRCAGRTALTGGHFDIIHPGHIRFLKDVAELCDWLFVYVHADETTRALKGPDRPVFPAEARAEVVMAIKGVSAVLIPPIVVNRDASNALDKDLIRRLKPTVFVSSVGARDRREITTLGQVAAASGTVIKEFPQSTYSGSTTSAIERVRLGRPGSAE